MPDKSEAFDCAFSKDDPTMVLLKRILGCFDLDILAPSTQWGQENYTVRLWDEGEQIASASGYDLESVLQEIDKSAAAIANYG